MKKFTGIILETLRREVEIEAEDEVEAQNKLDALYRNEEVVLTAEDWFDTDLQVTEKGDW